MLGFSSCETTTDPKLNLPADKTFVLNAPAFADQYLQLEEGKTIMLSCSQPDYGYAAAAQYALEVSLTSDFANYETLTPENPDLATIEVKQEDLAVALFNLHGFTADTYEDLPAGVVYFRATCELPNVEGSQCVSNVVTLNQVKGYMALKQRGAIYLVGNVSGWQAPSIESAAHYENWKLMESEPGSKVFAGSFTFPAGDAIFRFYTALTDWDGGNSLGSQPDDNPVTVTLEDGVYAGPCVMGKGSWQFPVEEECNVNLTVNLNDMTVKFEVGADVNYDMFPCMYIVGNVSGWKEPSESNAAAYADWRIYDLKGDGVYTSKPGQPFEYNEKPMFRLYSALDGWENSSFGSQADDAAMDVTLTGDTFTGNVVKGKGSWNFTDAPASGTFSIEYNSNTSEIKVVFAAAE